MKKRIVIIGGGISGAALLHYLKQTRKNDDIVLIEKNTQLGGTIQSLNRKGYLFETGPNGFLDSKPRTLEFIKELGLENSVIRADEAAKNRYISLVDTLHALPSSPKSFLSSKLLNPLEKVRILGEFFISRGNDPQETVYAFGKRRLGKKFSQIFLDPMVSGVFGGDARKTNLKAAFPRIYQLEQEYGSLFKAMIQIRKTKKAKGNSQDKTVGSPTGALTSLSNGLSQIIQAIEDRYKENICFDSSIETVFEKDGHYEVFCTGDERYIADELFLCTPAYNAASILKSVSEPLYTELMKISYAPMAVIGLIFPAKYFSEKPKGYGYLIPSSENKEILGVLFESDIFSGRCHEDQVLLRVMIGGARNPEALNRSKEELLALAMGEIKPLMGGDFTEMGPEETFFIRWEKAIPQYDNVYCKAIKAVGSQLEKTPKLHLVANYLNGVSLNDCIENAYKAAKKAEIS